VVLGPDSEEWYDYEEDLSTECDPAFEICGGDGTSDGESDISEGGSGGGGILGGGTGPQYYTDFPHT
jgi:hypothetical protein